jgi:hypothetical protein
MNLEKWDKSEIKIRMTWEGRRELRDMCTVRDTSDVKNLKI